MHDFKINADSKKLICMSQINLFWNSYTHHFMDKFHHTYKSFFIYYFFLTLFSKYQLVCVSLCLSGCPSFCLPLSLSLSDSYSLYISTPIWLSLSHTHYLSHTLSLTHTLSSSSPPSLSFLTIFLPPPCPRSILPSVHIS